MEEVYYLHNQLRPELGISGFLHDGKTLKQFMVHTYSNSKNIVENICIEADDGSIELDSNEKILDAIFSKSAYFKDLSGEKSSFKLIKSQNEVGVVYPRIYRPFLQDDGLIGTSETWGKVLLSPIRTVKKGVYPQNNENEFASSLNQLNVLIENLKTIFLTIHPAGDNLKAYGHNIRNLLILACTEVETQFRGILKENGYNEERYCTKDFFKLLEPLRLSDYTLKLVYYPWVDSIDPFSNREKESLSWYKNYNAVKHNRANEFNKGTLEDVILAISAVAILLYAQYGDELLDESPLFNHFFELEYIPKWEISDYYIPPHREDEWQIQNFPNLSTTKQ